MVRRVIRTPHDADGLARLLKSRKLPCTVDVQDGALRTGNQNSLAFKWFKEIADQLNDRTPVEVRAYAKLHFGVSMLRIENEAFRDAWDRLIRDRFSYEEKLELMVEPHDYPVTRIMTTKQKTAFLDALAKFAAERGVILTIPEAAA